MKNIFKSLMLVAVAAMGFACQENLEENFAPINPNEVVMTITADADETRTWIDETNNKVQWSEGDQLKVIENDAVYRTTTNTTIEGGKAQFTVSFPANTSALEYTYNAIFPATAVVEDEAEKIAAAKVKVIVKDQQKPTATSFDPQADVLVANQLVFDAQPTELNMQFKRLVAMGKMTLKNMPEDAKIAQVVFTAGANDGVAGRNYVNATTGKVLEYGYFGKTNVLTMNYDEAISTRDIYFTCNPFAMEAGETFKVKVVCEDKTYNKDFTIADGRSLTFTEGNLGTFSVDMKDATVETTFSFADGNYAVIAKSGSTYYAMKGVKGSSNFMTHVVVSYDGAAATFSPEDETLVWTIAAADGGYTFQNHEGKYLYWSSGNYSYLGNAQTLTITPIDGTNTYYVAVKETPERVLSYNASSPRFAFYGNKNQVCQLYLLPIAQGDTPGGEEPEEPEEPEGPQAGEAISVSDFLALKNTTTEYQLTGKITNVANTTYGNFNLTDATGTIYVYGLLTPDGAAQKQWAAAGLKAGDIITVKGVYNEYNGSAQIKNAVYVSHQAISVDKDSLLFTAEGGSLDVVASLVNSTEAISVSVDNAHFTVDLKSGTTYTVTAPANGTEKAIYANLIFTAGELSATIALTQEAPANNDEVAGGRDDFNTVTANSSYSNRKTNAGWTGTNCAVMQGGTSDSNPTFKFIGTNNNTRAFTMNGKTGSKGKIVSPTLTTGCGKLSLKYGNAFAETNGVDFTVTIKQNNTEDLTYQVDNNQVTKMTAYAWEQEVNIVGEFVIEITNNCPSNNASSNKDRVSIWDIEWTGYAE